MKFSLPLRSLGRGRPVNLRVVVGVVFVAAMFMNIMDGTVVGVALPTLSRSFAVPIGSVSGVVTAYLVTLAVAMPASGWLGDRFGGRNVLLAAITIFTAASALCGLASSLPELVGFRALQGLGGGTLIPVGMTMITRAFPPAAFIVTEQRAAAPMLRLRLYQDRLFRVTSLQLTAASGGFIGTLFLVPLLLQNGLGFSAVHSGLSTFTEALGGMLGVQLTTRLYKRVGPRRLMTAGMGGTVTTIGLMALAGPSDAYWLIPLLMFFTGCSFGFAMSPAQTANMATVTAAETGHASTLVNTVRQAGAAAGVALLGTVLAATGASARHLAGYHLAFIAAAGVMALGMLAASFVSDAAAAPTMAATRREAPAAYPEAA